MSIWNTDDELFALAEHELVYLRRRRRDGQARIGLMMATRATALGACGGRKCPENLRVVHFS